METQRYQPRGNPEPAGSDTILETGQTVLAAEGVKPCLAPTLVVGGDGCATPVPDFGRTTLPRTTVLPRLEREGGELPRLVVNLKPRYTTEERLGEGASGEVELALDNDIQRRVAVKRLKGEVAGTDALMRFVDEIRMIGSLEHPNIVPIHDVGVDEAGRYYFVMKAVQGETLEDVIAKLARGDAEYHRKYTFDYRVRVFIEICKAVEFAHARGIIHRDLKPANVMVGEHGEVMVMDWGIAKHVQAKSSNGGNGSSTEPEPAAQIPDLDDQPAASPDGGSPTYDRMYRTEYQTIVGTPLYMSPEQAMGRVNELDERSDVYSLCALLYEFLALVPYLPPKNTMKELLVAVVTEVPKWAYFQNSPHQSKVPAQFSHFVRKGLEKNPDERYQSVREMRETLQRVGEGIFSVECPITFIKWPIHAALRGIDRHPHAALHLVIASVLGLVALGVLALSGVLG